VDLRRDAARIKRNADAVVAMALPPPIAVGAPPWTRARPPRRPASRKSIAVLPFTDLSPQRDQEYFSDGIAEEILDALVKLKDLKVAGRTSSFSFRKR